MPLSDETKAALADLLPQLMEEVPELAEKLTPLMDDGDAPEPERDSEGDEFSFEQAQKRMTAMRAKKHAPPADDEPEVEEPLA